MSLFSTLPRSKGVLRTFRSAVLFTRFGITTSSPSYKPGPEKNQLHHPETLYFPGPMKSEHHLYRISPIPGSIPSPSPALIERLEIQHIAYLDAQSSRSPYDVVRLNVTRDLANTELKDYHKALQIIDDAIYAAAGDDAAKQEFGEAFEDSGVFYKDVEDVDRSKLDKVFDSYQAVDDLLDVRESLIRVMDLEMPGWEAKVLVEAGEKGRSSEPANNDSPVRPAESVRIERDGS